MATLAQVTAALESLAPLRLAADWDAVGLLVSPRREAVDRVMTCLTLTEAVAAEAVHERIDLVVTHHPLDWPNDAPIKGVTRGGVRGLRVLADAGAELFLSGHLHFASARLFETRALSVTSGTLSRRVRHEPGAFTVIRRPQPQAIETEVVYIVQGVSETASVRHFRLDAPLSPGAPAELHARAEVEPG